MNSKLTLRATTQAKSSPSRIARAVERGTLEFERDVKEHMRESIPGGRTYRTTPIVRQATRKRQVPGLRGRGRRGVIVGFNFHRASRRGQPPAIRTGVLINSIRGRMIGPMSGRVGVGAFYGLYLDDPNGLDRPFFMSRAELYRPRFLELIRVAAMPGGGPGTA